LIACSEKVEYRQAKVQKSYTVKNSHGTFKVYVQNHFIFDKEGIASYYSSGHTTATNEPFNPNYLTAAHPYVPLPCVAEVSLVAKPWKKVIVKINDRGPFTKDKRIIDLSYGAAQKLGFIKEGLAKVRVKILIKETLKLKEHGGTIVWKGERPFTELS
jgi:rare lipoprotein A